MHRTFAWVVLIPLFACASGPNCPTASGEQAIGTSSSTSPELLKAIPAEVRALADAPHKTSPNGQAAVMLLAEGHNAFVGKLELAPNARVPEHQDATEEYIHVLSGHATMVMDGQTYAIEPGTTIYMPAYATVSVQNGDAPLVGLQVFAGPAPARKYDSWQPSSSPSPAPHSSPE